MTSSTSIPATLSASPDGAPKAPGTLWMAGLIFCLSMLMIYIGGYIALRTDHVTQVPMFLKLIHPELYPRDWFLNSTGHYPVRLVFLEFNRLLYKLMPRIELVLFVQFFGYLLVITTAMAAIVRGLGRTHWFLVLWVICVIGGNLFGNIAKAPIIELQTIARMYPFAGCFVALACLVWRRPLLAGLALGLSGLVQAAPSLQFLLIAILWQVFGERNARPWRTCAWMVAGFVLTYWPQRLMLGDVISQSASFTTAERIQWMAFIRHPHHMLPHEFGQQDYLNLACLLSLTGMMIARKSFTQRELPLVRLFSAFLVFLLIAPIFIYVIPNAGWVAFQPFRMMAQVRLLLLLFLALHIWGLVERGDRFALTRAFFLIMSVAKADKEFYMLRTFLAAEVVLMYYEPRLTRQAFEKLMLYVLPMAAISWAYAGKSRAIIFIVVAVLLMKQPVIWPWLLRRVQAIRHWRIWYPAGLVTALGFLVFLFVPFRGWTENPRKWSDWQQWHFEFTDNYQVLPYPSDGLEWAALWAKQNTPPDALFVTPPERARSSFQYWSERSTVFNVKTFPYVQNEWPLYIERYFAMRGLLHPEKYPLDREIIMADKGGSGSDNDYLLMDGLKLVQIARHYQADYIITQSENAGRHVRLVGGPFIDLNHLRRKKFKDPLWIYKVDAQPRADVFDLEALPVNSMKPLDETLPEQGTVSTPSPAPLAPAQP